MDSTNNRNAIGDAVHGRLSPGGAHRRLDPVDRPPRPLGAKRSALRARKHRQSLDAWHAGSAGAVAGNEGCVLSSIDGTLSFAVLPVAAGLLIERRYCPLAGPRTAQTLFFDSVSVFSRWCDSEPVRLHEPTLHEELRRKGHEALGKLR